MYDLTEIKRRLDGHSASIVTATENTRQAAVALILRDEPTGTADPDILFIKRAEKTGDPWSGHMAFPGGHLDPEDTDLQRAAIRETWEEIGLDLESADYLGSLDQQVAAPRGRQINMLVAPHVFRIEQTPLLELNHEVAEVVWARLALLATGHLHDTETKLMSGQPTTFNGYRLEQGHFVWGMTYRMLQSFFTILDPDWLAPPEVEEPSRP